MNHSQPALVVLFLLSTVTNFLDCRAPFHLFEEDQLSLPFMRTKASSHSDLKYARSLMSDDTSDTKTLRMPHQVRLTRMLKTKKKSVLKLWKYFSKIRKSKRQKFSPITRLPY
jgi:hypothetical protein